MYQYNYDVVVYSKEVRFSELFAKVQLSKEFHMAYHQHSMVKKEISEIGDVIIWDLEEQMDSLDYLIKCRKKTSIIILCAGADCLNALPDEILYNLEAVWTKPMSDNVIIYQFGKVMDKIELEKKLWLTQNYLDTTIDTIPDMIWFKDVNGVHVKVNDSFCEAVDKTKEQITGRGHCYIWDLDMSEYEKGEYVCLETEEIVLEKKKTCLFDEKVKCKDGMRLLKTYKSPIFAEDGKELLGTVGIAHDMTNLRNLYVELNILLDSLPFSVAMLDMKDEIQSANKRLADIFGINKEQMYGTKLKEWEKFVSIKQIDSKGRINKVYIPRLEKEIIVELMKEELVDIFGEKIGYLIIFRDITLEQNVFEKNLLDANTDYLTGLFNRRYLSEYLEANRWKHTITLLFIDVDNFKQVNDTYGHPVGDEVLIDIADLLRKSFKEHNIFRLGGDEFLVAIPDIHDLKKIEEISSELQDKMENRFRKELNYPMLSVSIGIARDKDNSITPDELLKHGDAALYLAKQNGKNCIKVWQ